MTESSYLKAWRNWPTLLAKHYCFRLKSGVLFIANNSETNDSVCQAMLASFANTAFTPKVKLS